MRSKRSWCTGTIAGMALSCLVQTALAGGGNIGPVRLPSAQEVGKAVEEGVSNTGKAATDLVTLGEEGRRRDRERAEAQEREAAQARASTEALRRQKINDLSSSIQLLEGIVKSYDENKKLIDTLKSLHDKILVVGTAELESRATSMAFLERLRDSRRKQSNDLKDLVQALSNLKVLDQNLYKSLESKDLPITDADKIARAQAVSTARRILDTAIAEGETSTLYLTNAVEQLQTESLRSMVALSTQAKTILVTLDGQVVTQRATYAANLDGKRKELAALGPT